MVRFTKDSFLDHSPGAQACMRWREFLEANSRVAKTPISLGPKNISSDATEGIGVRITILVHGFLESFGQNLPQTLCVHTRLGEAGPILCFAGKYFADVRGGEVTATEYVIER